MVFRWGLLLLAYLLVPALGTSAGEWAQFRGPGGSGVGDAKGLPMSGASSATRPRGRSPGRITSAGWSICRVAASRARWWPATVCT